MSTDARSFEGDDSSRRIAQSMARIKRDTIAAVQRASLNPGAVELVQPMAPQLLAPSVPLFGLSVQLFGVSASVQLQWSVPRSLFRWVLSRASARRTPGAHPEPTSANPGQAPQ